MRTDTSEKNCEIACKLHKLGAINKFSRQICDQRTKNIQKHIHIFLILTKSL